MKTIKFKTRMQIIEVIEFDGMNFQEITTFIGPGQAYYVEYVRRQINRLGLGDGDGIFWLTRGCWLSRQENGLCYAHERSYENYLSSICDLVKEKTDMSV